MTSWAIAGLLAAAPAFGASAPAAAPATVPAPLALELQRARILTEDRKYLDALDLLISALRRHPESTQLRVQLAGVSARLYEEERSRTLNEAELQQAIREAMAAVRSGQTEGQSVRRQIEAIRRQLETEASGEGLISASKAMGKLDRRKIEDEVLRQEMARYLKTLQDKLKSAVARGDYAQPKDQFVARGFIWYYQGDLVQALRLWTRALELDPGDTALREQAAWVEGRLRLAQRKETIAKLLTLAQTLYGQGRTDEALAQTRALRLLEPEDDDMRMELQILEQKIAKLEIEARVVRARGVSIVRYPLMAAQAWLAVLDIDPGHKAAKSALETIQEQLVRSVPPAPVRVRRSPSPAEAAAAAAPPPAAPATRSTADAEQKYALGLIYYQQNDLTAAKKSMEASLRLDPGLKSARISLERINSELGAQ